MKGQNCETIEDRYNLAKSCAALSALLGVRVAAVAQAPNGPSSYASRTAQAAYQTTPKEGLAMFTTLQGGETGTWRGLQKKSR